MKNFSEFEMPSGRSIPAAADTSMETPRRIGLFIFFLVFGVFGLWSAFAPLEGNSRAPGTVVVKSNKKLIQHLEGGLVNEILVQNGDLLKAEDAILILDDTQSKADLEIFRGQYVALKVRESRLLAERDSLDSIVFPETLALTQSNVREEIEAQNQVFMARRASIQGESEVLEQRIEQLNSRLVGLRALKESKEALANSFAEELADIQALLDQGFSDKNRLRAAERSHAIHTGEAAELVANISSTEVQIGETRLQILQRKNEFLNLVVNDLSETQTELKDVNERIMALEDVVRRTVIRSPVDGVVNGLQVHTEGGVIGAGTIIAEIVPQAEELIIEAQVPTIDIDRIAVGQDATIRFSSFNSDVPTIFGRVITLSADAVLDQKTGATYYLSRIEVTPEGLADLGDLTLVPGMPVEAFIATGSRTFLQYAMKPFSNALARSLIED